ncbi:hypothetical protein ABVT39_002621 [Epinephelus coioides]
MNLFVTRSEWERVGLHVGFGSSDVPLVFRTETRSHWSPVYCPVNEELRPADRSHNVFLPNPGTDSTDAVTIESVDSKEDEQSATHPLVDEEKKKKTEKEEGADKGKGDQNTEVRKEKTGRRRKN